MTNVCVLLWLVMAALVWHAWPLPQPPILNMRRQACRCWLPWPGRVAVGVQVRVFVLSR